MVKNIYNKAISFQRALSNKRLKSILFLTLVFSLGLNSLSPYVYASGQIESVQIDSVGVYDSENAKGDILTETENVNDSLNTSTNSIIDAGLISVMTLCPECIANSEGIMTSDKVHPTGKIGLVSLVESNYMAMLNDPPTQNIYAHLQSEWLPGYNTSDTSVYAQDGYDLLVATGVDKLWSSTRNISYVIFILVLIVAGFMMMFRQKVGGQLAVTIFNTIPQVIIGLILVTFSFAIVGMALNLSAALTTMVASLLGFASPVDGIVVDTPWSILASFVKGDFVSNTHLIVGGGGGIIGAIVGSSIANLTTVAFLSPLVTTIVGGGLAIASLVALFLVLIVLGIVLSASVKIYITLLKAYVGLLIDTILAPFYLTMSSFPGKAQSRGDWFKRILKNSLTFTLVFFFVNLSSYIFSSNLTLDFSASSLSSGSISLTSGSSIGWLVQAAIAIYLLFVAAESPKFLDDIFPMAGGKSAAGALQAAAKGAFGKLPIVGGMIGG